MSTTPSNPAQRCQPITATQRRVLQTLADAGEPLFNGTLAARTDLCWDSGIFRSLEKAGLIEGHPYQLTDAGRAALQSEKTT